MLGLIYVNRLVNSKDITELQLKQVGCELVIRKKEALEPPVAPVGSFMMPPNFQQLMPAQPSAAAVAAPVPAPTSSAHGPKPSLPAPTKSSGSSHPPLKCPMAGTFYRSPAPGEPPFVKVWINLLFGNQFSYSGFIFPVSEKCI